jgi:hypothetical protein
MDEFKKSHLRMMEIMPKLKQLIADLTPEKKVKFDKKAEKKVNRAQLSHREKLQKQLNELTA